MPRQTVESFLTKLKQERAQLDSLIAAVESRTKQGQTVSGPAERRNGAVVKQRHTMSEATKAKLRKIMKSKWAAKKKG
jgi:hypothetical protein